jgi:hypothetical protein
LYDVAEQDLHMLGAFITINAVAWEFHRHADGQPNVFDDSP